MNHTDARPRGSVASIGLAMFAVLALAFSLVVTAQPVRADHVDGATVQLHQDLGAGVSGDEPGEFAGNDDECSDVPEGSTLFHFVANHLAAGTDATLSTLTADFSDRPDVTVNGYYPSGDTQPTVHFDVLIEGDGTLVDAWATFNVNQTEDAMLLLSHICGGGEGQVDVDEDLVLVKEDDEGAPLSGVEFTLSNGTTQVETTVDGTLTFTGLGEGTYSLTETGNPDDTCDTSGTLTVTVDAEGAITVTDDDEMSGIAIVSFDAETNTLVIANDCEAQVGGEQGSVEIDKRFCSSDEGTRTEIEVNEPTTPTTPGAETLQAPENGCAGGAADFTIYVADEMGNPVGDPVATESTSASGSVTFTLDAGTYVIVEDSSGESAVFTVAGGMLTIIEVVNFESGLVKVLKHNCEGTADAVLFSIDGSEVTGFDPDSCVDGTGTFQIDDGDSFVVEGEAVVFASVGSHTLTEISPMSGTSPSFMVAFAAEGELEPITTIDVYNVEGPEQGVSADLVLMKQDLDENQLSGVEFTLSNGTTQVETTVDGSLTFTDLDEGVYSLTETDNPNEDCDTSGTLTVTVDAEGDITVTDDDEMSGIAIVSFDAETNTLVIANDCEEQVGGEQNGLVKVLKHECEGDADAVLFSIDGSAVTGFDPDSCVDGTGTFQIDAGDSFVVEGEAVVTVSVGSHTLTEISPMTGTSASFMVALVAAGEMEPITTIDVYNVEAEGQQVVSPGENGNGAPGGEQGVQAGQGGPGGLPNTASQSPDGGFPAAILALVMLAGLGGFGVLNLASVRRRMR